MEGAHEVFVFFVEDGILDEVRVLVLGCGVLWDNVWWFYGWDR